MAPRSPSAYHLRMDDEDDDVFCPDQPWLYLLMPEQLAWREKQFAKGRDPDAHIEEQLREAGVWPPASGPPKVGNA
jgi:hypothetical protein